MSQLTLTIADNVTEKFPAMSVAAVTAQIDDPATLAPLIGQYKKQLATCEIAEKISTTEPITQLEEISVWRTAYGSMSVKPSKFHSSIEALLRRFKKGDDISTGLPVVELYNMVSILHGSPMGAYDLCKLPNGTLDLRLASPDTDSFEPLGGSADSFPLNEDLVVYASGKDVLCWGINTRDSIKSCVDENSTSIIFMSESPNEQTSHLPTAALDFLATGLTELGIEVGKVAVANAAAPKILI